MKIEEIRYGHWNTPTLPEDQPLNDAIHIGEFDGYEIYQIDDYLFIPNDSMCYRGYIRVEGNVIHEVYVPEHHRRRGIASILILFVLRKLGKKLIIHSDEIVTDDSRQVYYKLAATNKVRVSSNGVVLSLTQLGDIFSNTEDNDISLTLESKDIVSETCYEIRDPKTNLAGTIKTWFGDTVREPLWFD